MFVDSNLLHVVGNSEQCLAMDCRRNVVNMFMYYVFVFIVVWVSLLTVCVCVDRVLVGVYTVITWL